MQQWLAAGGQDYARGLALYEAHGTSRVVLTALRRGESEFTRAKLREELTRLAQAPPAAPTGPVPAPVAAPQARPRPVPAPPPPAAPAAPASADEAPRVRRSSWFAERHRLHAQLELLASDEERRVAAARIVQLSAWITGSYQPAPAAAEAAPAGPELADLTDVGEIRRRLTNLRALASKLKKNPARALDLQQAQADIKLLESKLRKP